MESILPPQSKEEILDKHIGNPNSHESDEYSWILPAMEEYSQQTKFNFASCMLSILDSLKLYDNKSLYLNDETLSEVMFRKMKAYDIDLNKELGFTHLCPVKKEEVIEEIEQSAYVRWKKTILNKLRNL